MESMKKAIILSGDFNKCIKSVSYILDKGSRMLEFQYIKLEIKDNKANFKTCNGYQLSDVSCPCQSEQDFTCYIKPLKFPKKNAIELTLDDTYCIIGTNEMFYKIKQPTIKEPFAYEKRIAEFTDGEPIFEISFNTDYLIKTLKATTATLSNYEAYRSGVTLTFHGQNVPAYIKSKNGDLQVILPIRLR